MNLCPLIRQIEVSIALFFSFCSLFLIYFEIKHPIHSTRKKKKKNPEEIQYITQTVHHHDENHVVVAKEPPSSHDTRSTIVADGIVSATILDSLSGGSAPCTFRVYQSNVGDTTHQTLCGIGRRVSGRTVVTRDQGVARGKDEELGGIRGRDS